MPSTTSSSVRMLLASSTVMTPSLPTFSIACAIISPISVSPLAEMDPTCATSAEVEIFLVFFSSSETTTATALSMPRLRSIGFMPAAPALAPPPRRGDRAGPGLAAAALGGHRVHARRHGLGALADDGLGEHGRGCGAVAGDVVGLGRHLAHHLRAHVLELVGQLDLLGHRHAVLGDPRRAEALVEHHVAAPRPARDPH